MATVTAKRGTARQMDPLVMSSAPDRRDCAAALPAVFAFVVPSIHSS